VKRDKVWRSDKAQRTEGGGVRGTGRRRDENAGLRKRAVATVGPGGYKKFGDIPAHKLGRTLRNNLYKLANSLPQDERDNLSSRMKYGATSVTASIAAGFGEGTLRSGITRALESRGALFSLQDMIQQLGDLELVEAGACETLSAEIDEVVAAVNDYLGLLAKENE
jgi:four helix bundle protein